MIAYFDASCLTMIVLEDRGHDVMRRWLSDTRADPSCSDFGMGELVSAVSMRVRQRMVDPDHGRAIVLQAAAFTAPWSTHYIDSDDVAEATLLVARFDLKLRLPDAIHIAVTRRIGATLVTSDRRQTDAAVALDLHIFDPLTGAAS